MYFYCEKCKKKYPMNTLSYKCECGGLFRLYKDKHEEMAHDITIGEMRTNLLKIEVDHIAYHLKMENLQPTGSFKDRGAYTLINELHKLGIERIAEDSSGNAGASIAAYAAAAGIDCTIFVPEGIASKKLEQIRSYGARVEKVKGNRLDTCQAIKQRLDGAYYASHVYNPLFAEGMQVLANEIYEQLGGHVPDYVFMPVGNGTMLLGLYYGFMELGRLPHLVAVQHKDCSPLYEAYHGLPATPRKKNIAEGIYIETPFRLQEMIVAVKNSFGDVIEVNDDDILKAKALLGRHGIYVEPTSAAALAGARKVFAQGKPDNYQVVIPLTGSGLKV